MDQRTAETIADPRWFPLRYDWRSDEVQFAWIPPETHRALTFISDLRPAQVRSLPAETLDGMTSDKASLHVILHSGLGGSTLLARALAQPGVVTTLKEPPILTDVVALGLNKPEAGTRALLAKVAALLSRAFEASEALVCKMSSVGNGLSTAIADMRDDTQILCLQTPLEHMLASLASKGREGRMGARRLFIGLQNARMTCVQLSEEQLQQFSDLQLAALAWLSTQLMIGGAAERFGSDRVRSITSEQLIDRPDQSLRAIAGHFNLALDVEARLASGVFERHAKTGEAFDSRKRAEMLAQTLRAHGGEIGAIVDWVGQIATVNGIALDLPSPLLD